MGKEPPRPKGHLSRRGRSCRHCPKRATPFCGELPGLVTSGGFGNDVKLHSRGDIAHVYQSYRDIYIAFVYVHVECVSLLTVVRSVNMFDFKVL